MKYECKICKRYESESLQRGFSQHLAMKHNLSVINYFLRYEDFKIPLCKCGENRKLRSGLFFLKTCGKLECKSDLISEVQREVQNRPEVKSRSQETRLAFMKSNPNQTAWRLNDKNQSWPEKFFEDACIRNSLDKQFEIVKELSIFPYYVDFAFTNIKVAVEIDGAQHQREEYLLNDKRKDDHLNKHGWRVFRIPANLMSSIQLADEVIQKLNTFIKTCEKISSCTGLLTSRDKKKIVKQNKINKEFQKKLDTVELIKNLEVDFSKFGWVNKVAPILNFEPQSVSRWMKRNMPDFYEEKCFKRK